MLVSFAEGAEPLERADIKIALVDDSGREASVYTIVPSVDAVKDILFRTSVPASLHYDVWALEISNPKTGQNYRLALDGKVPNVLHWDGVFSAGSSLFPQETYYFRLLLVLADKKVLSSPLAIFSTKAGTGMEYVQVERKKASFYVFPTGGIYFAALKTGSTSDMHFPTMHAAMRIAFGESHSIGFIVETSPNILTHVAVSPTAFFYSHVSAFYLYRIWGSLPHPPLLPIVPDYAKGKESEIQVPASAYGPRSNLEVGFRLYNNVMRGFGNQPIDSVLSRESAGVLFTLMADRRLGSLRASAALEGGYSAFRGSLFMAQAKAALSYDQNPHIFPSLEFRYQLTTGDAADDAYDNVDTGGPTGVSNKLLMAGISVTFKI